MSEKCGEVLTQVTNLNITEKLVAEQQMSRQIESVDAGVKSANRTGQDTGRNLNTTRKRVQIHRKWQQKRYKPGWKECENCRKLLVKRTCLVTRKLAVEARS